MQDEQSNGAQPSQQAVQRAVIQKALSAELRRRGTGTTVADGRGRGEDDPTVVEAERRDIEFLYETDRLLVREEFLDRVNGILAQLGLVPRQRPPEEARPPGEDQPRLSDHVVAGVRLLRLQRTPENAHLDTLETLRIIIEGGEVPFDEGKRTVVIDGVGPGVVAPNHVVSITGQGGGCPAVEPEPVPAGSEPYPGYTSDRCAGEGVRVVVVDTGLDPTAPARSPWLAEVTGMEDVYIHGDGTLGDYAGHGTFIAGVVRSVAPRAQVHVRRVFQFGGAVLESDLVRALTRVLDQDHPDVISMSAGTHTYDATGLLTFHVFNERLLRHHKGVVLVVAAGNDDDRKPFWPAAAPYTVSVGALSTNWRGRARFSNHGGWVDVYAPGQDLTNAFPVGRYEYHEPPYGEHNPRIEAFYGMARWSGTSFSTPIVAGLIAARMFRTGENGRDAAAALLADARRQAQPGVGAVLLPEA
ncbi:MAG TPA: S8/S53 family peptidase [Micromonosporaceae bacterium]|jgi:Subtilase family